MIEHQEIESSHQKLQDQKQVRKKKKKNSFITSHTIHL